MSVTIIHPILDPIIAQYLRNKRSLGRKYDGEEYTLQSLQRFLVKIEAEDLDKEHFEKWCKLQANLNPNTRRYRQRTVRNFCLYRQRTNPECFVPPITYFTRPHQKILPVILKSSDIAKILEAAKSLPPSKNSPLRSEVIRLAIVLLYTAGLRRGELLRLTLADVDARQGILHIRDSKFHKSRIVPLSRNAHQELRDYLKKRLSPPHNTSSTSPLLGNYSKGFRAYTGTGLRTNIRTLFKVVDVHSSDGRWPRVHDFRHNFAIEVLRRWYRQGVDVQSNLPKLAMYMGHVSIVSTAYYLKWLPDIAELASQRYEACFSYLIGGVEE